MKNILITTDFSENSIEAADFGIEVALLYKAKVYLLHVYNLPIPSSDYPQMLDFSSYESIKKNQLNKIKKLYKETNVQIECHSVTGFTLSDEIKTFCEAYKIDLVVMGLTGSSRLSEIFLGSNTMSMLVHSTVPILAIPKSHSFQSKFKLAFAFDGKEIVNQKNMDLLVDFSKKINSKIHAFHVDIENKDEECTEKLKGVLPISDMTIETEINPDTDHGILEYITNNEIEMLALIPRKHNFFDRIFHESHTKEIANYCKIPLLVLPD